MRHYGVAGVSSLEEVVSSTGSSESEFKYNPEDGMFSGTIFGADIPAFRPTSAAPLLGGAVVQARPRS